MINPPANQPAPGQEKTFEELLSEMQAPTEENNFDKDFDAQILDDDEDDEGDPENDSQDGEGEEEGTAPPLNDYDISDKDMANLLAILIDIVFAVAWSFVAKGDMREFRLDMKARQDISKACIPLIKDIKQKLSPEWLLFVGIVALQTPNAMKAFEQREKRTKAEKARKAGKKWDDAEIVEAEIIINDEGIPSTYGADGKVHPKTKKCGFCGKFGHNAATCPKKKAEAA